MKYRMLLMMLLMSGSLASYPISPEPLRKLILYSDMIIKGYVIKTEELPDRPEYYTTRYKATIEVIKQYKGEKLKDTIAVYYNPLYICPAPAKYYDSTYVMSFLMFLDGELWTYAMSYGVKTLSSSACDIYGERVKEMLSMIETYPDTVLPREKITPWLVKCALNQVTRWEGVYELSPKSCFMSYYDQDTVTPFGELMTVDDINNLRQAMLETNQTEFSDFSLLKMLFDPTDIEMMDWLVMRFFDLRKEDSWYCDILAKYLVEMIPDSELRNRYKKIEALRNDFDLDFTVQDSLIYNEMIMFKEKLFELTGSDPAIYYHSIIQKGGMRIIWHW